MNEYVVKAASTLAADVARLTEGVAGSKVDVCVFPPHPFLYSVNTQISSSSVKVLYVYVCMYVCMYVCIHYYAQDL